jgi:uncharacterized membrane protein YidH (DUF202 family)
MNNSTKKKIIIVIIVVLLIVVATVTLNYYNTKRDIRVDRCLKPHIVWIDECMRFQSYGTCKWNAARKFGCYE